jgi:hypothetical protein
VVVRSTGPRFSGRRGKMAAWACYEGEARPFPFPRSYEGLKTLAEYRGMMSNLKMAEAFRMVRMIVK